MSETRQPSTDLIEIAREQNEMVYRAGTMAAYLYFRYGAREINRPMITGTDRVPSGSQEIWVFSHRKASDIPLSGVMASMSGGVDAMTGPAKKEFWEQRIGPINVGRAMELMGAFPVNNKNWRDRTNIKSMRQAEAYIAAGHPSGWFVEGTRRDPANHEIGPISPGVIRLAQRTGLPMRIGAMAYTPAENGRLDVGMAIGGLVGPPETSDKDDLAATVLAVRFALQETYNEALSIHGVEPTVYPGDWSSE